MLLLLSPGAWSSLQSEDFDLIAQHRTAQLICANPAGANRKTLSLATPVAHQGDTDIFLVPKHGITSPLHECAIRIDGHDHQIDRVISGSGTGLVDDWAIASTRMGPAPKPERFILKAIEIEDVDALSKAGGTISVSRNGASQADVGCKVLVPRTTLRHPADGDSIFVSDCPMVAGKSGAPAIARVGSSPTVIGMGLGYRIELSHESSEWKRIVAVIRVIDSQITDAVRELSMASPGSRP